MRVSLAAALGLNLLVRGFVLAQAPTPTPATPPGAAAKPSGPNVGTKEATRSGDEVAMIAVKGDGAKYWPRWRGPSGQGLAAGKGYVVAVNGFSASPVGVDGKVFFTNDQGETFVLKAGRTFELLHVNRMNERMLASPALVGGTWYFRTHGHLMAVGR